ncbi:DUF503 domain-containing protein [Methylobacterium radiotolerans]|uniref:Uncharacterized protein YlxP (DUF503 family) n=1 Tax=Deinococcus enclensis TaxID=1049582 RepID=A0ABT9MB10_9DEIO|nr:MULTISPECIES: DUF503 family protein [Deinococcus]MDP9763772.1 uncharacterized protein YlxP (DUF503 family) [Deinococcus enclensis]PJI53509.1 DUF503 domain-containing protein [Methylobacterium radiotolerans]
MALGYVGVLTIRVEMPWVENLKEKRALVRPVVERLKVRFPLTVARLDGLDAHDWEVIGVATISNDYGWVQDTLRMAADYIAKEGPYRVTEEHTEIRVLGDEDDAEDEL